MFKTELILENPLPYYLYKILSHAIRLHNNSDAKLEYKIEQAVCQQINSGDTCNTYPYVIIFNIEISIYLKNCKNL